MTDRDGVTCTTCMTLNPPGAPSCVRCNTPLAATAPGSPPAPPPARDTPPGTRDTPPGTRDTAPGARDTPFAGLAGGAAGAPNSSRALAVAVQPPGYGTDTAPLPEPEPTDPDDPGDPGPDTRVARRVTAAGLVLVALLLVVGGGAMWLTRVRYLDAASVATAIETELSARGGGAVTVNCPGDPRRHGGEEFRCVATDTAGGRRTVTVTVLDDDGHYRWALER